MRLHNFTMPVSGSGGPIKILKYNLNRDQKIGTELRELDPGMTKILSQERKITIKNISFIGQCPSKEYRAEEENVERCTVLQKSNENRKVDSVAKIK